MKGSEFIRKVKKLAKERSIESYVDQKRGKGSHVTLYFGDNLTIVRNPKDELKTGTFKAMLNQLGIEEHEI
ncbi:MAG: type II toxin-antitoxin system HicA family toxin [Aphanizomenon flos-aquae DEX188]|jgi:mRNA interferase HicA|nr:MAG: type II toxin-antitoxin system HicA family toxin [Aphanizomenon flos-aquae DEX188]